MYSITYDNPFEMSDLFDLCPNGAWVSEDRAVQLLGLTSKSALKDAFTSGALPHVYVEHGKRHDGIPELYSKHRFFFIQKEGTTCTGPSISLATWVNLCQSIENGGTEDERMKEYTNASDLGDLKAAHGIMTTSELAASPSDEEEGGYRYGSNGGKMLAPSKASSFRNPMHEEGEIYTRADGKKVRRVKKSSSGSFTPLPGESSPKKTLAGFLSSGGDKGESKLARLRGSQSVAGGEGEIYVRADGKKGKQCLKTRSFYYKEAPARPVSKTAFG